MNKKIKMLVSGCAALMLICAAAIAVYAYLGAKTVEKENTIVIGSDTVSIAESFSQPEVHETDETYPKQVKIANTGDTDCFVRVYMAVSDSRLRDSMKFSYDGSTYSEWDTFVKYLPYDWKYIPESGDADSDTLGGYFYYTRILPHGAETSPLLDSVKTAFANTDALSAFDIIVYSETVQTIDTDGTEFTDSDWRTAWKRFLKYE